MPDRRDRGSRAGGSVGDADGAWSVRDRWVLQRLVLLGSSSVGYFAVTGVQVWLDVAPARGPTGPGHRGAWGRPSTTGARRPTWWRGSTTPTTCGGAGCATSWWSRARSRPATSSPRPRRRPTWLDHHGVPADVDPRGRRGRLVDELSLDGGAAAAPAGLTKVLLVTDGFHEDRSLRHRLQRRAPRLRAPTHHPIPRSSAWSRTTVGVLRQGDGGRRPWRRIIGYSRRLHRLG